MTRNQSTQLVKNFSGMKTLEEVTAQLDLVLGRLGDILDNRSQTVSLLDPREPSPTTKAGDFVIDYTTGKVVPGMSDGKNIQPFNLDVLSGTITAAQHGLLAAQLFDADGALLGDLHPVATNSEPGFMSAGDKSRFNNLTPGGVPQNVNAAAGTAGIATTYSRSDHVHQVAVGTPVAIGTINSAGTSDNLARRDHVHAHGELGGGNLHDNATTTVAGFLSPADKTELVKLRTLNFNTVNVAGTIYLEVTHSGTVHRVQVYP